MTSQKNGEDVQCEYVYDQNKSENQHQSSIFFGEYYEEDSEKDGNDLVVETRSTSNTNVRGTKNKRRTSRYDEDNYALPDSDEEAELSSVKLKLNASNAKLVSKEKQLFAWRTVACVSICIILISTTGIVYLAVEKNSKGINLILYINHIV